MCGRVAQFSELDRIVKFFGILRNYFDERSAFVPRYNIAPEAEIAVVSAGREFERQRTLSPMSWGFHTARNELVFNARSETARVRPLFSNATQFARCLVPVDGFFEWRREGRARIPFYFSRKDGAPLALGAIARRERDIGENRTCVMTTQANDTMAGIHHRMPVILEQKDFDYWLSGEALNERDFSELTRPAGDQLLEARLVSPEINRAGAKSTSALIAPAKFPSTNDLFGNASA